MTTINKGFDSKVIEEYKSKIGSLGFLIGDSEDNSDDSELYELAEEKTTEKYPEFNAMTYSVDENGDLANLTEQEEEIGLFMTELILELEDEGEVKVKEHVEIDTSLEFGVGLDVGLNVEVVSDEVILDFINSYNADTLKLDETLYAFETEDVDEI